VLLLILFFAFHNLAADSWWLAIISGYFLFVIGNNMFSSRKDMEGVLATGLGLATVLSLLYIIFFVLPLNQNHGLLGSVVTPLLWLSSLFTPTVTSFFRVCSFYLMVPIVIDLGVIILARLLLRRIF